MVFDYEARTKNAYKSTGVARGYHAGYTGKVSWQTLRFHFIARREQRVIADFVAALRPSKVLDIPCGTGKLAAVFAARGCEVIAADISAEMLEIAGHEYQRAMPGRASWEVCDVEQVASRYAGAGIDTVVCLRLMHRLPADVRSRALDAIARVAPNAIISFGISSPYHRARRRLRNLVFRRKNRPLCQDTLHSMREELRRNFEIRGMRRISPLLSEEVVFLLQSRA